MSGTGMVACDPCPGGAGTELGRHSLSFGTGAAGGDPTTRRPGLPLPPGTKAPLQPLSRLMVSTDRSSTANSSNLSSAISSLQLSRFRACSLTSLLPPSSTLPLAEDGCWSPPSTSFRNCVNFASHRSMRASTSALPAAICASSGASCAAKRVRRPSPSTPSRRACTSFLSGVREV